MTMTVIHVVLFQNVSNCQITDFMISAKNLAVNYYKYTGINRQINLIFIQIMFLCSINF